MIHLKPKRALLLNVNHGQQTCAARGGRCQHFTIMGDHARCRLFGKGNELFVENERDRARLDECVQSEVAS